MLLGVLLRWGISTRWDGVYKGSGMGDERV
jgi:hypothetical protein